ncbi:MAG TPA: hypothetical protein VNK91_01875 [Burkholderiaceae bacterium]|nr:hypothetical protein [Burkholderiaceae bacterium]
MSLAERLAWGLVVLALTVGLLALVGCAHVNFMLDAGADRANQWSVGWWPR